MKGYFAWKPVNMEDVKGTAAEEKKAGTKPTRIRTVGRVILSLDEYIRFCDNLLCAWDFLEPYKETTKFAGCDEADCVLAGAPGQRYIAVCMEGYSYARYAAWTFPD